MKNVSEPLPHSSSHCGLGMREAVSTARCQAVILCRGADRPMSMTCPCCWPCCLGRVLLTSPAAGCKIMSFMEENYLFALFLGNDNLLSVRARRQLAVNGRTDIHCVSAVCRAKHFDTHLQPLVPLRQLILLLFSIIIFYFLEECRMNSSRNKPQNDVQRFIPVASSRWTRLLTGLDQCVPCCRILCWETSSKCHITWRAAAL